MSRTYTLCGIFLEAQPERILQAVRNPAVDMIEWRMDSCVENCPVSLATGSLRLPISSSRHPVIATNRPARQGGLFAGAEVDRLNLLRRAVDAGVEWVDLEDDVPRNEIDWFKDQGVRTILSHHDFEFTPQQAQLQAMVKSMVEKGADVVKIATLAHTAENNIRLLELIAWGEAEFGVGIVAFCMGHLGRWSRLVCLELGSPWTYVALPGASAAAPGQFEAGEARKLLGSLFA